MELHVFLLMMLRIVDTRKARVCKAVGRVQGLKTDKRGPCASTHLHGHDVLADGVARVQLVGHFVVILAGHTLADGGLHQPGEGGQHVDGGVDLPVSSFNIPHLTY